MLATDLDVLYACYRFWMVAAVGCFSQLRCLGHKLMRVIRTLTIWTTVSQDLEREGSVRMSDCIQVVELVENS